VGDLVLVEVEPKESGWRPSSRTRGGLTGVLEDEGEDAAEVLQGVFVSKAQSQRGMEDVRTFFLVVEAVMGALRVNSGNPAFYKLLHIPVASECWLHPCEQQNELN
jgi:hypothetical protein